MNIRFFDFEEIKKRNEKVTSVISLGNEIVICKNEVLFGEKIQEALKKECRKQVKNRRKWG